MSRSLVAESPAQNKLNLTKNTKDSTELLNLSQGKLQRVPLLQKQATLFYQNIPMPKSLPQWNISSTTLRHSTSAYQFSRSDRFPKTKCNYQDTQQIDFPSTLNKRSSSFGYGNKLNIPQTFSHGVSAATKLCPAYDVTGNDIKRSNSSIGLRAGKTFGLGWKHYQPSRTSHRSSQHSPYQVKSNPGPNKYQINPQQTNKYAKIKMHERLEMFSNLNASYRLSEPHPQSYDVKEQLMKSHRSTGIGLGSKTDFTKLRQRTPGPIYQRKGFCDEFVNLKLKGQQL